MSSRVAPVPVPSGGLAAAHLPAVHFADAYAVAVPDGTSARALAEAVFAAPPRWVMALMAIRHAVVAPLGLVATRRALARAAASHGATARVGSFPVLAEAADEVVLGLDDRHLDFRVSIRVDGDAGARRGIVTTRVRFHGALGRAYFVPVGPAHRRIVPAMLRRAATRLRAG